MPDVTKMEEVTRTRNFQESLLSSHVLISLYGSGFEGGQLSLQWKRGLQRLYLLIATVWIVSAGGITYWQLHSEKLSVCSDVQKAETVKHNAALRRKLEPPVTIDMSKAQPIAPPNAQSSTGAVQNKNAMASATVPVPQGATFEPVPSKSLRDRLEEVAEAEKEGIDVSLLDSVEYNRTVCNSTSPVRTTLEVAFIPAILGYGLFLAGCWVVSGFKSERD